MSALQEKVEKMPSLWLQCANDKSVYKYAEKLPVGGKLLTYVPYNIAYSSMKNYWGDDGEIKVILSEDGKSWFYNDELKMGYVITEAIAHGYGENGGDLTEYEWLPIVDDKNNNIPFSKINSAIVHNTLTQCAKKNMAKTFGSCFKVYLNEDNIKNKDGSYKDIEEIVINYNRFDIKYSFSYLSSLPVFSKEKGNIYSLGQGRDYIPVNEMILAEKRCSKGRWTSNIIFDTENNMCPLFKTGNGTWESRTYTSFPYPTEENGEVVWKMKRSNIEIRPVISYGGKALVLDEKNSGREAQKGTQRGLTKVTASVGLGKDVYDKMDRMETSYINDERSMETEGDLTKVNTPSQSIEPQDTPKKVISPKTKEPSLDERESVALRKELEKDEKIKKELEKLDALRLIVSRTEGGEKIHIPTLLEISQDKKKGPSSLSYDDIRETVVTVEMIALSSGIIPRGEVNRGIKSSVLRSIADDYITLGYRTEENIMTSRNNESNTKEEKIEKV